jgi:hypothetical protein
MKNRSLLILATIIFFSLLNWQCSSDREVNPQPDLSGMYLVSQFISGDSTFSYPRAYISTTQLSRDQIQVFFTVNQNGKESSKDLSNFNIEPISNGSYAILRAGTRVGLIDRTNFSLNLDANSPNRFYIEAQK